jgi:tRNA(adenine34) deaminase
LLAQNRYGLIPFMKAASDEACLSLREGNHGFGAVIIHEGEIISQTHDSEETDHDPTAHAELEAIMAASVKLGKDLSACTLICTHEPCPTCATAIVRAKIGTVAYGYAIADAIRQSGTRIDLPCAEIFRRAGADIHVISGLMGVECALLYDQSVRVEMSRLRGATAAQMLSSSKELAEKRHKWFHAECPDINSAEADPLWKAYRVLLKKLEIQEDQAPVIRCTDREIVFRSMNSCPTLEACKILGLDTRKVCKLYNEGATDALVKLVDSGLEFSRNYERLRPEYEYCEEIIRYKG